MPIHWFTEEPSINGLLGHSITYRIGDFRLAIRDCSNAVPNLERLRRPSSASISSSGIRT